jgi:hypothetical protein
LDGTLRVEDFDEFPDDEADSDSAEGAGPAAEQQK